MAPQAAVEARIEALLGRMTVEEKFGQLQQLDGEAGGEARPEHATLARAGRLGSTLNVRGAARVNALQKIAVEESRLGIPLIFGFDVIHGYRTIFPIPLGAAASWDPDLVERVAAVAAAESRAAGVTWTFAPMVDIARDARWGRVAEGAGEDPWLGAAMAAAQVRGFQGTDYAQPTRVVACAKHWVAYGAAEAGRDYSTTEVSERTLRTVYFPPFRAALEAGAGTVMSAFNDLNGVPASANRWTLTSILRREWLFDGLVVSDYNSVRELINHGVAAYEAAAATQALDAGVDMEMVSRTYNTHGPGLVASGAIPRATLDEAVRRVLRVKLRTGLFERPFADPAVEATAMLTPEARAAARALAARSLVLLENRGVLPLDPSLRRLAVIGSLADDRENMMGNWTGDGRAADVVTILAGVREALPAGAEITFTPGVAIELRPAEGGRARDEQAIREAERAARAAGAAILVIGETGAMSGEASSRSSLDLPGRQLELAQRVIATGVPTVVVLMNGRPLSVPWLAEHAPALVEAWFPGTEGGHAVADVLFGAVNPGGKLPMSFPRTVGQAPIYYNQKRTGRPPDATDKYTSKYLDVDWTPLYPFGFGRSYTEFTLRDLRTSATSIAPDGTLAVSVEVANAGQRAGDEVVQLYLRDLASSVTRPVRELRGFRRVHLEPGQAERVTFTLGPEALGLYDRAMHFAVEPGTFEVMAGVDSNQGLTARFDVRR
jgi:beta-glucosidase